MELDIKRDIKTRYFGGYDIRSELQQGYWMALDEWEAHAMQSQQALVEAMAADN